MLSPDFWKLLDQRLAVYAQFLEERTKKNNIQSKNQNKTERQLYEDRLDRLIQLKTVFDKLYNYPFP